LWVKAIGWTGSGRIWKKSANAARREGWAGVKISAPFALSTCSGERDGREDMAAPINAQAHPLTAARRSQIPQFLGIRMPV
jgi:hypothetical protein